MTGKRVPLVIYRNGVREEIGTAYVEDSGIITGRIFDRDIAEKLGFLGNNFKHLSIGFTEESGPVESAVIDGKKIFLNGGDDGPK